MNRKKTAMLTVIAFICGIFSFYNARLTALNEQKKEYQTSAYWLNDASGTVVELEKKFNEKLNVLIRNLVSQQKSLAKALEDPCTPNEIVLSITEDVIKAHEHLIRRVGEHVIELRSKLSGDERDYLMDFCAEAMRGPMSRLGERAGGGDWQNHTGRGRSGRRGYGYGHGGYAGRGDGAGYGQHLSAKERLAHRLGLNEQQITLLQEKDPDFEADSIKLRNALMTEMEKLLSMFENTNSSDYELMQQIEQLISTHNQIERRIAEHVMVLRPYLTVEQQKWLIGLCRWFQSN